MNYLVLVRHGQSEWNLTNVWTGLTDIPLTKQGIEEAKTAGKKLKEIHFDYFFTSKLKRAIQTMDEIKNIINSSSHPAIESASLNERDYGDYTGKNKLEIEKEAGEETFLKMRRSWDYPIPNGESLKQVYARVIPYYKSEIEPKLKSEKNILIVAHGNSLRALVKYLENISDNNISHLEIATGQIYKYTIDTQGKIVSKNIL